MLFRLLVRLFCLLLLLLGSSFFRTSCLGGRVAALASLLTISVRSSGPLETFHLGLLCRWLRLWSRVSAWTQLCQVSGSTTCPAFRTAALHHNINVSAVEDDDFGDLIKFWPGQCHHNFIVTGGNARLPLEEIPSTGPESEKKAPKRSSVMYMGIPCKVIRVFRQIINDDEDDCKDFRSH